MVPRYSIIIPTLNEEKFLPKLLASLTEQADKDFEVIVVDGKSRDKTLAKARSFQTKLPLSLIRSAYASLPLQRNLGAKAASGTWLVFVDADSILMPYFTSRITHFIETERPKVFTTWVKPDLEENADAMFSLLANMFLETSIRMHRQGGTGPLTVIRRDVFASVGGYNESHAFNEDMDLGLRLDRLGIKFKLLRETLYVWSMRRIRREGKMKVIGQYILAALPIFLLKRPLKSMPGYVMGGHLYRQKKPMKRSTLKAYENKLKKLMKELFD